MHFDDMGRTSKLPNTFIKTDLVFQLIVPIPLYIHHLYKFLPNELGLAGKTIEDWVAEKFGVSKMFSVSYERRGSV